MKNLRMCIVCRSRELVGKRRTSLKEEKVCSAELVRLSFVDGSLRADLGYNLRGEKRVGRGAYVHNSAQCLAQLAKRGRLEQALRVTSRNSELSKSELQYGSFAAQVKEVVSTLLHGAVNNGAGNS